MAYYVHLGRIKKASLMMYFFVQAENGIRGVERSGGVGDVYKRKDY